MAPRYENLHFTKPRDHNQQDMIEVIHGTPAHDWKRLRESLRVFRYEVSGINHQINDSTFFRASETSRPVLSRQR